MDWINWADMISSCHPACGLIPERTQEEIATLARLISENGLAMPIVVSGDQLLDGRARLLACHLAHVRPRFAEWDGREQLKTCYVVKHGVQTRSQLTVGQRACIAAEAIEWIKQESAELGIRLGEPREVAAAAAGCTTRYASNATRVLRLSRDEFERAKSGERSLPDALRRARYLPHPAASPRFSASTLAAGDHAGDRAGDPGLKVVEVTDVPGVVQIVRRRQPPATPPEAVTRAEEALRNCSLPLPPRYLRDVAQLAVDAAWRYMREEWRRSRRVGT